MFVLSAMRRVVVARAIDNDEDEEEEEEEEDDDEEKEEEKEPEAIARSLGTADSAVPSRLLLPWPLSFRSLRKRDNTFMFSNKNEDDGCRGVMT